MSFFKRLINQKKNDDQNDDPALIKQAGSTEDLVRAVPLETTHIGDKETLVYCPHSKRNHMLPTEDVDLLERLTHFDTIEKHADQITASLFLDPQERSVVATRLDEFAANGLLVSRDEIKEASKSAACSKVNISTLSMITCDRVNVAKRSLAGFIDCCKRYERSCEFSINDDSKKAETRNEYRRMLLEISSKSGALITYAGKEEKQLFAGLLIAKGLPKSTVEFSLFGMPEHNYINGANMNTAMLHTVGDPYFHYDDDVLCQFARSPSHKEGLQIDSDVGSSSFIFFKERAQALAADYSECDPLKLHEEFLGQSLVGCIAAFSDHEIAMKQADDRLTGRLLSGSGSVGMTSMGIAGDSGMGSTAFFMSLRGRKREQIMGDAESYRELITTRNYQRAVRRSTITSAPFLMTPATAIDNRQLFPPFLPAGRNADGVMGFLTTMVTPQLFISHLPWMVAHDPPNQRKSTKHDNIRAFTSLNSAEFLMSLIGQTFRYVSNQGDTTDRLKLLGNHLKYIGNLALPQFEEITRTTMARAHGSSIGHFENLLEKYDYAPEYWANDVEEYLENLRKKIVSADMILPVEFADNREPKEALKLLKRLVFQFGDLLEYWPDIVEAAGQLRQNGTRLAQPIDG